LILRRAEVAAQVDGGRGGWSRRRRRLSPAAEISGPPASANTQGQGMRPRLHQAGDGTLFSPPHAPIVGRIVAPPAQCCPQQSPFHG